MKAPDRSLSRLFVCVGLTLFAGACLTPPGVVGIGKPAGSPGTAAPVASLGDFTRNSPELLAKLRMGWNMGNSLDAPTGETTWGNPQASPALFAAVAKAGFGVVRVPVTWATHMGPAPGFVLEPTWVAHVKQIVGFARAAGLYSIINLHHDGADGWKDVGWIALKDAEGKTTAENNAAVRARFVTVWTQIAKAFGDEGEDVLFESMNEIHDGYGKPDPRHYTFINELNQEFVNLVRASGGNNSKRHLVVAGYNTNIAQTLEGFKVPSDSAKSRLILTVHYYDPYLFALMAKTHTWGRASEGRDDWAQEDFVVAQFDKLKAAYIDKGIPVIIGEYGAVHQDGYEDYVRYYMEYVTKAAIDRKLVPVYWDNGGRGSGENSFALIDRQNNSVFRPKLMEAMQRAVTSPYELSDVALPAGTQAALPARGTPTATTTAAAATEAAANEKDEKSEVPGKVSKTDARVGYGALPFPPTKDVPRPNAKVATPNLRVLPWAGFTAAVTYTFDDSQPSQVEHWSELKATGVPMTFFVNASDKWQASDNGVWTEIAATGSEIGNHTWSHCRSDLSGCTPVGTAEAEIDKTSEYIVSHLGVKAVSSFAAPFGDAAWNALASSRFLVGRGVMTGFVSASGTSDWYNLPCFPVAAGQTAAAFNTGIDSARSQGSWLIFMFHSIMPTTKNWYAGVEIADITASVAHGKKQGDMWIDTIANVGAYARAQQMFEGIKQTGNARTWKWTLPAHFPAGKVLRVTLDGGKLSQGKKAIAWDSHGYYEVSLDAGSLTWKP